MERYSSAVESKSRKDYARDDAPLVRGGPEPEVFREAATGSARRASASGVRPAMPARLQRRLLLLALRNARDWRRGEDIQLQELQDHHIFPQAYLKRHGITKARRRQHDRQSHPDLRRDERQIKDKAPADYILSSEIFPNGASEALLEPHFLGGEALDLLRRAHEGLSQGELRDLYQRFLDVREAAIIAEIRRRSGVEGAVVISSQHFVVDEVAPDIADETDRDELAAVADIVRRT